MGILEDLKFGEESEKKISDYLISIGYEVFSTKTTDIHDFVVSKNWKTVSIELKTRRCESTAYEDTLIWSNKLGEAWNRFYKNWEETLFFFQFIDWLFYINALDYLPKREYKLQRWDRGIDSKKGWIYFNLKDLIKIH